MFTAFPAFADDDAAIRSMAEALEPKLIGWRRDIHQHPELSNREFRTSELVAEHLRSLGLEVRTGIAHTGVAALLEGGKPGPIVALRADMDALPVTEQTGLPFASEVTAEYEGEETGVMHACGHDAHTAILMATAELLAAMKEDLPGSILFIFQPAEEGAPGDEEGGAELMLKEGLFEWQRPDALFGLHVFSTITAGHIGYRSGPAMAASDRFEIVVRGRQTHGSRPWGGIDPVVPAAQIVLGLQNIASRQVDISRVPAVISVGSIHGGIRNNIIPNDVRLVGTIRTFDDAIRADIHERVKATADGIAGAAGATADVHVRRGYPVTANDPDLVEASLPSLQRAAGEDRVYEVPLVTGAEDFSYFANEVPGFYFFLGATPEGVDPKTAPSNHSPEFDVDESTLRVGLRALATVTVDYLARAAEEQAPASP
ncbi:MAG TPA: amidohydrolase [Gammaproteobacteria bacterium]|nr:amidohydrolase [Gammaproteobacteria bacterium]